MDNIVVFSSAPGRDGYYSYNVHRGSKESMRERLADPDMLGFIEYGSVDVWEFFINRRSDLFVACGNNYVSGTKYDYHDIICDLLEIRDLIHRCIQS